jgi:glutathione S-transferase
MNNPYVIHGLKISYFTGKLEAYFKAKGLPYDFFEMDTADFRRCASETGFAQMPQLETPDGTWVTDTTKIISDLEDKIQAPAIRPTDPAVAFCAALFEDFFDEWFWRPALYYRWAFKDDMNLMSAQIARTMLRDMPLPFFIRRRVIRRRQRKKFLWGDGVNENTRQHSEDLFHQSLTALEPVFKKRDFFFGDRPCEADFGMFGPFFRHFSYDPTASAIMREEGPNTFLWVARLWAIRPEVFQHKPDLTQIPDDLGWFFDLIETEYLPYLKNNADQIAMKNDRVHFEAGGETWKVPAAPYRVDCLNALKRSFQSLAPDQKAAVTAHLPNGVDILNEPETRVDEKRLPPVVDRLGRKPSG